MICSECNLEKELSEFYKDLSKSRHRCKSCAAVIRKEYRDKNIEKIRENEKKSYWRNRDKKILRNRNPTDEMRIKRSITAKKSRLKNIDKVKEQKKNWYLKNKEYSSQKNKEYRIKNTEQISKKQRERYISNIHKYREYSAKNKEKKSKYAKEYIAKNKKKLRDAHRDWVAKKKITSPVFKARLMLRNRVNAAFKIMGVAKRCEFKRYLGAEWDVVKSHLESQFKEGMTWNNRGLKTWHIDHIIPISSAKTEEELIPLFHYTNLQPLWAEENIKKGAKILI